MAIIKSGSVAIVTGGASGIGFEFVQLLVAAGVKVAIADLKLTSNAQQFLSSNSNNAIFIKTDVTSWSDLQSAFDATIKSFGDIDLIVPNAGVFEMSSSSFWRPPGSDSSSDTIEKSAYKTLEINITHPIRLTQMGIEYFMKKKKAGHILLVSSIAAQTPTLTKPVYCASKAAVSMFVRSLGPLAEPPKDSGIPKIVINAIAPGMVDTPLWYKDQEDMKEWAGNDVFEWLRPLEIAEEMLKMVMTDDDRYKGGNVVERTLGKTRVVGTLNDDKPEGRDAPPRWKILESLTAQQEMNFSQAQDAPAFREMKRMMEK